MILWHLFDYSNNNDKDERTLGINIINIIARFYPNRHIIIYDS